MASTSNNLPSVETELMSAWKIHHYNGMDGLQLVQDLPIPKINKATDVLIQVKATSVNVLDVFMTGISTHFKDILRQRILSSKNFAFFFCTQMVMEK